MSFDIPAFDRRWYAQTRIWYQISGKSAGLASLSNCESQFFMCFSTFVIAHNESPQPDLWTHGTTFLLNGSSTNLTPLARRVNTVAPIPTHRASEFLQECPPLPTYPDVMVQDCHTL